MECTRVHSDSSFLLPSTPPSTGRLQHHPLLLRDDSNITYLLLKDDCNVTHLLLKDDCNITHLLLKEGCNITHLLLKDDCNITNQPTCWLRDESNVIHLLTER